MTLINHIKARVLLFVLCFWVMMLNARRLDLVQGIVPIVNANDTIHVRGDYVGLSDEVLVLPCNVALVGDTPDATLTVQAIRFGRPSDTDTVYCDVHLTNLTLLLRNQRDSMLDTSATHYYRLSWRGATLIGNVPLLADGGELDAIGCIWTSRSNVTISRMTVVHVRDSTCIGCALRLYDNDVLAVTHNTFDNASVALIYDAHPHRLVPRIVELLHNAVASSRLILRCAQADIKTSAASDGMASFDVQDSSSVGHDCFIDYETPPSIFYSTAFAPLNFAL